MRSYTKNHLERAARLAILSRLSDPNADPERIIRETVLTVSEEGEPVYPRWTVLQIAARAAAIYNEEHPMLDYRGAAEASLREIESA